jgi:hypothetical protein
VALHGPPPAAHEHLETAVEPGGQLGGCHRCNPRRGELDRERDPVEAPAHLSHRRGVPRAELERRVCLARPLDEQAHGVRCAD